MSILEIENLVYTYDNRQKVLKNISVQMEQGKMYAILGPSGCGKTTLLSLLGGLDSPTKGKILYNGEDIEKLVRPILEEKADIVIGERPIDDTEHFSPLKKKLQHFGSWTVRVASKTDIPDAPSGFRAYSRDAAMRLNVTNEYTYTLETIIQAGRNKIAMKSVPVRTNPELRKSRLFSSMFGYVKRSMVTIVRSFMMYKPLRFFTLIGGIFLLIGLALGIRFLVYFFMGAGTGHIQSLILASTLSMMGFMTVIIGLQADVIAGNRKLLEDIQYHVRKLDYDAENSRPSEEDK